MAEPKWLKDMDKDQYLKEDFDAQGKSHYTVADLTKNDPDWLIRRQKKHMLLRATIMSSLIADC